MRTPPDRSRQHREFSSRPLIEQVKDLFSLHTSERRGIAALVVLLFIGFVIVVYVQWFRPPVAHDKEAIRNEMMAWLAKRDSASKAAETLARSEAELFHFDPNEIDDAAWRRLGLSEKQAASIMRYRAKGGRFRTKADLGRMYALRPEQVAELTPYVLLPDSLPSRDPRFKARWSKESDHSPKQNEGTAAVQANYPVKSKPQRQLVEVNTADTAELIALPGIGPAFARGIVKYRESLGGYFSLDQLAEVYVLKDKP
ncbi:MAG: helix-hairpin-helix domain-containing protein [Flavobacteriales bacterium]|nr:helix-hairpin-helix domain-containing protein [Flavobacteriales bacterium]